jgi:hypothetical protein
MSVGFYRPPQPAPLGVAALLLLLGSPRKDTAAMPSGPDATSPAEGELVAVIARTRAVAERWKTLHLREEGMCAEQRQLVRQSARAVDSAREMRDKAVEVQKVAQMDAVAAKHDKARWRARADAQSNAKVFLEAERLRGMPQRVHTLD